MYVRKYMYVSCMQCFFFPEIPHPCHPNPCKNGAKCKELQGGEYDCECPPGTSGKHCEGKELLA